MTGISIEVVIGLMALVVAGYGLLSGWLSRHSVSPAFSFVVIGAVLGGVGVGIFAEVELDLGQLGTLAELTLALVLFTAASTVRLHQVEHDTGPAARLLAIGLTLTIVLGTALALGLFPGISLGLALIIGSALAPTDADLGHPVIIDDSVPARVRRLLNVESGLNDGIAAPVLAIGIALATVGDLSGTNPVVEALRQLGVAAVVGLAIGLAGRWLLAQADTRGTATSSGRKLAALSIAMAAYLIAVGLESSGFIAAFVAGLMFGIGSRERVESAVDFSEALSVLLSIVVWLAFGLLIADSDVLARIDLAVVLYALLSLTVIRMVPVAIALIGDKFDRVTVAFMGWFGPRGLASIVFALLAYDTLEADGAPTDPLLPVVATTVALSVVLHGLSARPLAAWFGRYATRLSPDAPEFLGDEEPRRKRHAMSMHEEKLETET
jgi:NhaP-type Na+/H+ or K+/H+ antiporter